MLGGLASTTCDENDKNCASRPFPISESWFRYFLKKDPEWDFTTMTEDDFFDFLHMSRQRYTSIIGSDDPDLSAFRSAGGKMITWHGLADELIFPNGSLNYYERVLALDPKAPDFIRLFEAPGVEHCSGGPGAFPGTAFQSLVNWVEKGKAPDKLDAATVPVDASETVRYRPLCPYPSVQRYKGGDPNEASSFECAATFGTKKAKIPEHGEL
jgi:feruloyl esterase